MVTPDSACVCMRAQVDNRARPLDVLESIRQNCPALQSVFLPEDTWSEFQAWHAKPDVIATHCSMLLLALKRRCLARLTGPVHRYLFKGGDLHKNVDSNYKEDLKERWMLDQDPVERHRRSKIFSGKVTELQCAEWLEACGWHITDLAALGADSDIEAKDCSGRLTAFEVKFIGDEDDTFQMILKSIEKGASARVGPSLSSSINYLLFRVYEAAKQLAQFNGHRAAVIVID